MEQYGSKLKAGIEQTEILPFIGVYDTFSASIAAQHFDNIFISGFSFAASYYGLPDIGFIAWPDIVDFTRRVRSILPEHNIIVDMDDGYSDIEVACHAAWNLEQAGASAIVLEDQQRPRRCGHLPGKQILPVDDYVKKLERVLETRREGFWGGNAPLLTPRAQLCVSPASADCGPYRGTPTRPSRSRVRAAGIVGSLGPP